METGEIQIRPYKWSAWDFQIFMREQPKGHLGRDYITEEFAYITTEHKWVTLAIDGDYTLVPVEQHELLAELFHGMSASTDMHFVIDGLVCVDEADGGYIDMEFSEQHLKTEYATRQKLNNNHDLCESEILYDMGFKDYEDKMDNSSDYARTVIKFNNCHRKLGE